MNHQSNPLRPGGKPFMAARICADSGSDPDDSKIFLTVIYKYRYKLCCVVNVTGKFVKRLGIKVIAKG